MDSVYNEKDLGLILCKDLKWDVNIQSCVKDVNKTIAWIKRNLMVRDPIILSHIYKTIIRPKLEYCVQLWNPVACQGCHGN